LRRSHSYYSQSAVAEKIHLLYESLIVKNRVSQSAKQLSLGLVSA